MAQTTALRNDFADRVAQLRATFVNNLEDRILDLECLKVMVVKNRQRPQALGAIASHAHKIRGVAATFGFDELGAIATEVDDRFSGFTEAPDWTHDQLVKFWNASGPLLETMLDEMEKILD